MCTQQVIGIPIESKIHTKNLMTGMVTAWVLKAILRDDSHGTGKILLFTFFHHTFM